MINKCKVKLCANCLPLCSSLKIRIYWKRYIPYYGKKMSPTESLYQIVFNDLALIIKFKQFSSAAKILMT